MDDDTGGADDADEGKPEKRKSSIRQGLLTGRIELFLLALTVVEKLTGLTDHWLR